MAACQARIFLADGGSLGDVTSCIQSCVKTFLLNFENHYQNVPLPTQNSTMAQYFSQPFPKPGRNVIHYSVEGPKYLFTCYIHGQVEGEEAVK